MAEIQMFQPGTAFMNSYNQAKAGSLAKIAFTEPQRRQSALADLYGLDPQAANSMKKEFDAQEQEQLKTFSTAFLNTTDNELRNQMWGRAKAMWQPRFQALGSDIPDDWRQALPTIQALAGAGKGKYTGAPIIVQTENGPKYARYSDSGIELTQFAPDDRFTMNVDAEGNVRGYNTRRNVLTPTADGSQQQDVQTMPPPAGSGGIVFPEDIPPAAARVSDIMEAARREIGQLVAGGMPVDQATTLVTQKYAKGRGLTMPTQGQAPAASQPTPTVQSTSQPPRQAPVTPARVAVRDQGQLTPYQEETLRLQREAAERAEAEAAAKAAERKAAADAKAKERQDRVSSAQATTDNLLDNIRQLKSHPGFKELGTLGGNAADSALPEFVPTDYRGAKARLETIKGQIALQAMAELKALSNTGATGFGALAVPELTLLQNSIQTLTTSQNNGDIMAALDQIEKLLTKAKSGQRPPAQTPSGNQPTSGKRVGRFVIEEN